MSWTAKLPFAVPKLRRFLGAPYVPMKRHAVEVGMDLVMAMYGDLRMTFMYK